MNDLISARNNLIVFDHFTKIDTLTWTTVDDGGTGTNTCNATLGGELSIVTAAADNDYHYYKGVGAFRFNAGQPVVCVARIKLTEGATNVANWIFGLSSVVDATVMGADGAGPPADYYGAVLFKVDGTMTIQAETSITTVQTTNTSVCAFTSGSTYQLKIKFDPDNGTTGLVTFEIYDETAGVMYQPAAHRYTCGTTALIPIFGVKAGAATVETLKLDYVGFHQVIN